MKTDTQTRVVLSSVPCYGIAMGQIITLKRSVGFSSSLCNVYLLFVLPIKLFYKDDDASRGPIRLYNKLRDIFYTSGKSGDSTYIP